jgi:thymidylate synthase
LDDYHIYEKHIESTNEQLKRKSYDFPQLVMTSFETLEQIENATIDDFKIIA